MRGHVGEWPSEGLRVERVPGVRPTPGSRVDQLRWGRWEPQSRRDPGSDSGSRKVTARSQGRWTSSKSLLSEGTGWAGTVGWRGARLRRAASGAAGMTPRVCGQPGERRPGPLRPGFFIPSAAQTLPPPPSFLPPGRFCARGRIGPGNILFRQNSFFKDNILLLLLLLLLLLWCNRHKMRLIIFTILPPPIFTILKYAGQQH